MKNELLLFIFGFILLIKGGDWFVDGATGIAKKFRIPEIIVGATIVSIGTTLPEVMVSANSAIRGVGSFAYGNAIGSVICNTALISAITIAVSPAEVDRKTLKLPVIFFFGASCFYLVISYFIGEFYRWTGIVLLCGFIAYVIMSIFNAKKNAKMVTIQESNEEDKDEKDEPFWKQLIFLVLGAGVIALGADLLVDNGTLLANRFGVPESVVALTMGALGTSLPELVTAITSLIKGRGALSLGNLIGANLFNLVLVSGIAVTIAPFSVPLGKLVGGLNASLVIDIPVMLGVSAILTIPTLIRGKLSKLQGYALLAIYVAYVTMQFVL